MINNKIMRLVYNKCRQDIKAIIALVAATVIIIAVVSTITVLAVRFIGLSHESDSVNNQVSNLNNMDDNLVNSLDGISNNDDDNSTNNNAGDSSNVDASDSSNADTGDYSGNDITGTTEGGDSASGTNYADNGSSATSYASKNIVMIDESSGEVLYSEGGYDKIYPASMTKIMTLIVAVEELTKRNMFDSTYTFSKELLDYMELIDASGVGFVAGETATVDDLLYGLILPSGCDAAVALATIIAGGEDEFAVLMNNKAKELGLTNTHFVNATGLHDDNHYTTPMDMIVIMQYAMSIDKCARILRTSSYTTSATSYHPSGINIKSETFSYFAKNDTNNVSLIAGKTGFTDESGYCMVVYVYSPVTMKNYIVLTAKATTDFNSSVKDIVRCVTNAYQ